MSRTGGWWRRWGAVPAVLAALLTCAAPVLAADTDLVVLKNGDRIRGEVKNLELGRLEYSTTSMGIVYVEWDKVVSLTSPQIFEVETTNGARSYGSLDPAEAGKLAVVLGDRTTALDVASVVRIRPIRQSFWRRLDGSINLGASFTQSSQIGQGSLSLSVIARRPAFEISTKLDTTLTVQPDEPDQSRTVASLNYVKLLRNRWFVPGTARLESNTDLGLTLRSSIGGGVGRDLIKTNRSVFDMGGGFLLNQENPVSGEVTENVELFVGVDYEFFTYDTPKTSVEANWVVYPSLSVNNRYRTEFNLSLRRELIRDFTVGLTAYDSYDSKPPEGSSSKHDYGFSLSVGWVF